MEKQIYYTQTYNKLTRKIEFNSRYGYIIGKVAYEYKRPEWFATDIDSGMLITHFKCNFSKMLAIVASLTSTVEQMKRENQRAIDSVNRMLEFKSTL